MQATCIVCHQEYEGEPDPLDRYMAAIWDMPLQLDGICEDCQKAIHAESDEAVLYGTAQRPLVAPHAVGNRKPHR